MKEAKLKFTKLNDLIWRKLPACKEVVKLITASMDGRLGITDWIIMKVHLFSCDSCVNFVKQVSFIRSALRRSQKGLDEQNVDIKLSDNARGRIKEALKGEL
jgi:hypothetical protein